MRLQPNYEYVGEVVRIVDGDTVEVIIDQGFDNLTRQVLRLDEIDAPEMRGETKEAGVASRLHLVGLIAEYGKFLYMTTRKKRSGDEKRGKFGRYLVTLLAPAGDPAAPGELVNLNHRMVHDGHARWLEY